MSLKDVTINFSFAHPEWETTFHPEAMPDNPKEYIKRKPTGKTVFENATLSFLVQPFGFSMTVSSWGGEHHYHWLQSGGHACNVLLIDHPVDSPIVIHAIDTTEAKDQEAREKLQNEVHHKWFEMLGNAELAKAVKKVMNDFLNFKFDDLILGE